MNQHYNLWSKAGTTPNFGVTNPEEYLKDFKWLSNWFDLYFFNKVSDFIDTELANYCSSNKYIKDKVGNGPKKIT